MAKRTVATRAHREAYTEDGSTVLPSEQEHGGVEEKALEFAEDLGRLLGTVEKKAKNWLDQRQEAVKALTHLRDTANQLLAQLGEATAKRGRRMGQASASTQRRSQTAAADNSTSSASVGRSPKRSGMSAAQRRAVSQRMRKYWAARRKGET